MAGKRKKYKNMKLEQNELMPTAIGIFETRKKGSFGTILILGIFILVVIFLPQISERVNNYLNPKIPTPSTGVKPNKPVVTPPTEEEDNFYEFVDNLQVTNTDITVSNIVVDSVSFSISYDVSNNLNQSQNMAELNYFMEIFNKEGTMIERIKLADDSNLSSGAFKRFSRSISSESATTIGFISIVKKTIDDYPDVELANASNGNGNLVCTKNTEKVTYKFQENKLKELTSEIQFSSTLPNYQTIYEENKVKVNTYNNNIGVSSTLVEYETGYNIVSTMNLSEASRMYLFGADSFLLDTEPKVVKFEAEAQGFKCE